MRFLKALVAVNRKIVYCVQVVLVTFLLVVLYVVGVGVTAIALRLWHILSGRGRSPSESGTFWKDASGYQATLENAVRQS